MWFPKTDSFSGSKIRRRWIHEPILDMLLKLKADRKVESPYVFCAPTGGILEPGSQRKRLQRVLKDCGMEKIRFHDLRHTFATLGAAKRCGCENPVGTAWALHLDTYGHISTQMQQDAAQKVGGFLRSNV